MLFLYVIYSTDENVDEDKYFEKKETFKNCVEKMWIIFQLTLVNTTKSTQNSAIDKQIFTGSFWYLSLYIQINRRL